MTDKSKGIRLYENLLSSLANAPRGDTKLDVMIAYYLGNIEPSYRRAANLLVDKGFAWELIANLWEGDLPKHTCSLDAALPGENITAAVCAGDSGRWAAIHTCEEGRDHVARASTEVLARRLAALKWLTPDRVPSFGTKGAAPWAVLRPVSGPEPVAATTSTRPVAPPVARAAASVADTESDPPGGWKIRF